MFGGWLRSHLQAPGARQALGLLTLTLATASPLRAAEVPEALIVFEATTPFVHGQSWSAAPLRFVLLQGGEVFVGGSKELLAARLDKAEIKALEMQVDTVRKLPGLASVTAFGGEEPAFRLRVSKGKALDLRVTGDPGKAPAALRPLAALLEQLLRFDHPSLRPYAPANLSVVAREATRPGGCRLWTLGATPAEAALGTTIAAGDALSWLPGVDPSSVCVGDKRYEVQLRPLVPGERP